MLRTFWFVVCLWLIQQQQLKHRQHLCILLILTFSVIWSLGVIPEVGVFVKKRDSWNKYRFCMKTPNYIALKMLLRMGGIILKYGEVIRPKDTLLKNWSWKIMTEDKKICEVLMYTPPCLVLYTLPIHHCKSLIHSQHVFWMIGRSVSSLHHSDSGPQCDMGQLDVLYHQIILDLDQVFNITVTVHHLLRFASEVLMLMMLPVCAHKYIFVKSTYRWMYFSFPWQPFHDDRKECILFNHSYSGLQCDMGQLDVLYH